MTAENITAVFAGIAAVVTPISLVLVEYVRRKVSKVAEKVVQVEKQGNNASLELKRVNMVYAKRLAVADDAPENVRLAEDAERVYEEARKANERL